MRAAATPARAKELPTLTMLDPEAAVPLDVVEPAVPAVPVPEEPPVVVPGAVEAVWADASCLNEARDREALAAVLQSGAFVRKQRQNSTINTASGHTRSVVENRPKTYFSLMTITMPLSQWRPCAQ